MQSAKETEKTSIFVQVTGFSVAGLALCAFHIGAIMRCGGFQHLQLN